MTINRSKLVVALYLSVLLLLPFSRYAELPILILSLMGIDGVIRQWHKLKSNRQFKILFFVFVSYLAMILISAPDSYWQDKTLLVGVASSRFFFATIVMLLYVEKKHFAWIFKLIASLILFWTIDALFQYLYGIDLIGRASYEGRLNGIFGEHHVKLGPVLALFLPVVMIALRHQKSFLRWLSIVLMVITIILSGTRSAWIMMLFTLIAYWFHHVKYRRFQLFVKALIIASVLISSLWFVSPDFQQRIERSMAMFDGSHSAIDHALANRLPIWKTSWNMIQQHPINGIGAHGFRKAYANFAESDDIWQQKGDVGMHAHHWILEVLAETGIIGLIIFIYALYKLVCFVKSNYHQHFSWAFSIALVSAFLPLVSTYSIFASFWSICIWYCGSGLILMSQKND